MHRVRVGIVAGLVVACLAPLSLAIDPPKSKVEPHKKLQPTKWIPLFEAAQLQARKQRKYILAYFGGTDWEPYTQKLEKDVLNTELFQNWAAEHVILFQADFTRDKKLSPSIKGQNERLKQRFSIIKVPTFILMDFAGVPFGRGGFDDAKLRDTEEKGQPKAFINWIEETIKNRPPDESLTRQKTLAECIAYGNKHFISSVLFINKGRGEREMQAKEDLTHNQQFVRFINRNVAYAEVEWPFDADGSADAKYFRDFIAEQNAKRATDNLPPITDSPLQLLVYDMQRKKVVFILKAIDPTRADTIVQLLEAQLPKIDYVGGWVEDYRQAFAIAQQQKRFIFLAFLSMDGSEFSKKIWDEIFEEETFKKYCRKKMVMVKLDFPKTTTQPTTLVNQNKMLAEMYNIRGYPTVIVLNPMGQKISDAKYMKDGAATFLKNLQAAVKSDEDRRAFLAGEQ